MNNSVQHINPEGLSHHPAFTHVIVTQGPGKTIYIGGQNAVDAQGNLVGKGDVAAQTTQVMHNLQVALTACGAEARHLIKLSIYLVQGQHVQAAFEASRPFMATMKQPPVITVLQVAGLANPDYLVEIEAVAFVP